jgi:hypothetical protein
MLLKMEGMQGVNFSDGGAEEVFEDVANFFRAMALIKSFADVGEFNRGVPTQGIVESRFVHNI